VPRHPLIAETRGPLTLHRFDALESTGATVVVTDRHGGISTGPYASLNLGDHVGDDPNAVAVNRERLAAALGVSDLKIVRQVHGATIVDADDATPATEADGIVVEGPIAAAILVADCVPIVLVDAAARRLVLVHAGWRGLAAGVLSSAMAHLPTPERVVVAIGPAISQARYQVGPEVAEHFAHVEGALVADGGDRSRLDLRAVAVNQLRALGVDDDAIHIADEVTDGGTTFFSDRAERPCGRFAMAARWQP
jgi:hypothetical protein